jgi:NADH:ubiquinone oxidoreductase subunit C
VSQPTIAPAKVWHIPYLESDKVENLISGLKARVETLFDTIQITVALEDYRTLCERLFKAGFDFPSSMSGTDFEWGLGVALQLQQLESKRKVTVRTYCTYQNAHVPTVSDLWGGVDWHEREAYDLVGIIFDGHEDSVNNHPRRILLEDHWSIHPLQKRYNTRGYLIHGWTEKPFPTPAPWEEGFQPFSGAPAPVAHVAPPASKAVAVVVPNPLFEGVGVAGGSSSAEAVAPIAQAAPISSDPPKKVAKKWIPKGEAAPAEAAPVVEAISSQVAPIAEAVSSDPIPAPVAETVSSPEVVAEVAPEEKPRNPKIKRWEPR